MTISPEARKVRGEFKKTYCMITGFGINDIYHKKH